MTETKRWHHHNLGCSHDPELGWACTYTEEERHIYALEADLALAQAAADEVIANLARVAKGEYERGKSEADALAQKKAALSDEVAKELRDRDRMSSVGALMFPRLTDYEQDWLARYDALTTSEEGAGTDA